MGYVTYLGVNFPVDDLTIGKDLKLHFNGDQTDQLALTTVQNEFLHTKYVYAIQLPGQLDDLNPQAKIESPLDYELARESLEILIITLRNNLEANDFAAVYFCWFGDEEEKMLGAAEIDLLSLEIPEIHTEERFLIRFNK